MYRIDQEADRSRARSLSAELESARRGTDQLRSLTLRGDATVQDLLTRLKVIHPRKRLTSSGPSHLIGI